MKLALVGLREKEWPTLGIRDQREGKKVDMTRSRKKRTKVVTKKVTMRGKSKEDFESRKGQVRVLGTEPQENMRRKLGGHGKKKGVQNSWPIFDNQLCRTGIEKGEATKSLTENSRRI